MSQVTIFQSISGRLLAGSSAVLLGFTLTLSGCGDSLAGKKYVEESGNDGIEFKSGNKAYVTLMGHTIEAEYSTDGDKVLIKANGQNLVLTRTGDGTLTGLPMAGPLRKKS